MTTFITGASGTGKSALVSALCSAGIKAVDMDVVPNIARWLNRDTGTPSNWQPDAGEEWHGSHDWIVSTDRLSELLRDDELRVVAGLSTNQLEFVDQFDLLVLLQCSEMTFLQRIQERPENRYGRQRSERKRILGTYKQMEAEMLRAGAIPIDTDRDLDLVTRDVSDLLDQQLQP
jgi:dephospho-CoA kinase